MLVFQKAGQSVAVHAEQDFIAGDSLEGFFVKAKLFHGHGFLHRVAAGVILDQIVQVVFRHGLIHALCVFQELCPVLRVLHSRFISLPLAHGGFHLRGIFAEARQESLHLLRADLFNCAKFRQ